MVAQTTLLEISCRGSYVIGYHVSVEVMCKMIDRPEVDKTICILNSTEHEISTPHTNLDTKA